MFSEILKAYIPTGKPRGRPKGSKNGQRQAKPVSPSHAASFPSENPLSAGTFKGSGEAMGGKSFTDNVMVHNNKENADSHESFIHGHLVDSGYKPSGVSTSNNIKTTMYEHANGDKVMVNNGTSGDKNFVGYKHTPAMVNAKETDHADLQAKHKELADHHYAQAKALGEKGDLGGAFEAHRTAWVQHSVASEAHGLAHSLKQSGSDGYSKAKSVANNDSVQAHDASSKTNTNGGDAPKKSKSAIGTDGKVDTAKFHNGIAQIKKLTNINDHNNALAHGAHLLGRDDIAAKAKVISDQHKEKGFMNSDLIEQRNALHDELDEHAKKVLSPKQHAKFHGSY